MTPTWPDLTSRLIAGSDLSADDTAWAMDQVMSGATSPVVLAGFLTALATKGETIDEVRGLADAMLDHAEAINVTSDCVDIVGTGGDRLRTVNISTTASLVIAAAGVNVVKHGNRASSSASGSADCLEQLGIALDLPIDEVEDNFHRLGITFLFANLFHPSMKHAAVARRELAVGTAFNVLGPLTNPARPSASAIGVFSERHAPIVAGVLADRGTRALVFRGRNGMDEISATTPNQVWEVRDGEVTYSELDVTADLGIAPATVDDLRGQDAAYNANVARTILENSPEASQAVRDAVALNSAAAFVAHGELAGVEPSSGSLIERMGRGLEIAYETIDSGRAADLVSRWVAASQESRARVGK